MPEGQPNLVQMVLNQSLLLSRLLNRANLCSGAGATQKQLLQALAEGEGDGLSVPQLARISNTSRQNVQIIMDRLRLSGWVETRVNPAHKRSPLYRMTSHGLDRAMETAAAGSLQIGKLNLRAVDLDGALRVLGQLIAQLDPGWAAAAVGDAPRKTSSKRRAGGRAVPAPEESQESGELPVNLL